MAAGRRRCVTVRGPAVGSPSAAAPAAPDRTAEGASPLGSPKRVVACDFSVMKVLSDRVRGCTAVGEVYDSDRVMFLRACLTQLQRATPEGVPVDGYLLWSAQDKFEWTAGYGNRFGLIYVDFDTLERTPKLSAECPQRRPGRTPSCSSGRPNPLAAPTRPRDPSAPLLDARQGPPKGP
jgi:hypothetical protein